MSFAKSDHRDVAGHRTRITCLCHTKLRIRWSSCNSPKTRARDAPRLAGKPCSIDTSPLPEIQYPPFILWFLAAHICGKEGFRTDTKFPFKTQQIFLQRMNIDQNLLQVYNIPPNYILTRSTFSFKDIWFMRVYGKFDRYSLHSHFSFILKHSQIGFILYTKARNVA